MSQSEIQSPTEISNEVADSSMPESASGPSILQSVSAVSAIAIMLFSAWLLVRGFWPFLQIALFLGLAISPFLQLRWFVAGCLFVVLWHWLIEQSTMFYQLYPWIDTSRVIVLMIYLSMSMRVSDLDLKELFSRTAGRTESPRDGLDDSTRRIESDDSRLTFQGLRPLTAGWFWIPAALILALAILRLLPLDFMSREKYGLLPNAWRAISILWLLVLGWFVASGFFILLSSRLKDRLLAHLYARSTFCRQMEREITGIEKRRSRFISRNSRKKGRRKIFWKRNR